MWKTKVVSGAHSNGVYVQCALQGTLRVSVGETVGFRIRLDDGPSLCVKLC